MSITTKKFKPSTELQEYMLPNFGRPILKFMGVLLVEVNYKEFLVNPPEITQIVRVYQTKAGVYVLELKQRYVQPKDAVETFTSLEELGKFLSDNRKIFAQPVCTALNIYDTID